MAKKRKIYIIAGESSGDIYGAGLIESLTKITNGDVEIYGVGGKNMEKKGLRSLFDMSEISIMGFWEIIPHIPKVLGFINKTVEHILKVEPDVVVTIDSPGFCCRVAKKLKGKGIKLVHYVAPTVWAYKPKRASKFAKLFDHLLVILPFEPPYFKKVGLPCTYIGHPITETNLPENTDFRKKYMMTPDHKIMCVMPGSRITEVKKHMKPFVETILMLQKSLPNLRVVFPVVSHLKELIENEMRGKNIEYIITETNDEKFNAFYAANVALVKSGTGTLEVAMAKCPMVVAYKVGFISHLIIKSMVKIRFANLINIIANREIIPELLQNQCNYVSLSARLLELINNKDAAKKQTRHSMEILQQLGLGDKEKPSEKAARTILDITE